MGLTNSANYTATQNDIAALFKALAHPARIAIIEFLLSKKTCITNHLVEELPLAQPTISKHLNELKQVEIIQGTIEGNSVCYCLNPDKINTVLSFLENIKISLSADQTCC